MPFLLVCRLNPSTSHNCMSSQSPEPLAFTVYKDCTKALESFAEGSPSLEILTSVHPSEQAVQRSHLSSPDSSPHPDDYISPTVTWSVLISLRLLVTGSAHSDGSRSSRAAMGKMLSEVRLKCLYCRIGDGLPIRIRN